jgi:hypothetical protein
MITVEFQCDYGFRSYFKKNGGFGLLSEEIVF